MKTVLITGTSTGIGQATAIYLARHGYHVFASMRSPEKSGNDLTRVAADENLHIAVLPLDVTNAQACELAVNTVIQQVTQIDVLINNAGIGLGGYLEEFPEHQVRATFETNFFGAMRMMQLVIPHMREAQRGTIVNVSSIMGRIARAGGSAYSASKWALEAVTESLAQEVHRFNIRLALIEPGVVETPLHRKGGGEPQPDDSDYQEFTERGARLFSALLKTPSSANDVAQVIHHAIETDEPKLRYLVGTDAQKWLAGRQGMSDEDWVDVGRKMTLDQYVQFYRDQFDIEI